MYGSQKIQGKYLYTTNYAARSASCPCDEKTAMDLRYHRAELVGVHGLGATQAAQADQATMG